ncbi:MAG: hypothetical protein ABI045_00065 [Flavobacteriales bacterium]
MEGDILIVVDGTKKEVNLADDVFVPRVGLSGTLIKKITTYVLFDESFVQQDKSLLGDVRALSLLEEETVK